MCSPLSRTGREHITLARQLRTAPSSTSSRSRATAPSFIRYVTVRLGYESPMRSGPKLQFENGLAWRHRMKTYVFRVVVEAEDDAWIAYSPTLKDKGGATWGRTESEAIENVKQVIQMTVDSMIEHGEAIPEDPEGDVRVIRRSSRFGQCMSRIDFSRLRSLTARRLIRGLTRDGFVQERQRGSHRQFYHVDGRRVTVSAHRMGETFPTRIIRIMIQDQAKWNEEDLRRLGVL